MRTFIRAAALALLLQQAAAGTAELVAQGQERSGAGHSGCSLVTEREVEAATGLDYTPGDEIEQEYEWIDGGETCMWGGPSMVHEDLPEINITFIAVSPRGRHMEWRRKRQLRPECTREPVGEVGDQAFAESCKGPLQSASVYAQTGESEIVVSVYQQEGKAPLTSAPKQVAIAIAKAAAARATAR